MTTTHEPDRVQELEAKVAELTAMVERLTPSALPAVVEEDEAPRSSRRGMLKLAGAVAAGAAATVVAKGGQAAAADGGALTASNFQTTTAATHDSTGLIYQNTNTPPTVSQGIFPFFSDVPANVFTVRDSPGGIVFVGTNYSASDYPAAIGGFAYNKVANGVYGKSNGNYGVVGEGTNSTAVGVLAKGGKANLQLLAAGTAGPKRIDAHVKGEVIVDSDGNAWICVADGTPGTWRKLAGASTAGSFHAITPTRVYDSRASEPSTGALTAGGTRTLSMKDARDLTTGAVTTVDLVPAGATAITANVTVVNTVGAGFLAVNPGGNTTVSAATINWFGAGQILNNGVTLTLSASREVTVIAGGGSTDFVIDVTGYFL